MHRLSPVLQCKVLGVLRLMAGGSYEVLQTAKSALDEGLINEADYDKIKSSFLRAQQIKAGLDAGFIKEEEYANVKRSFLESLSLSADIAAPVGGPTRTRALTGQGLLYYSPELFEAHVSQLGQTGAWSKHCPAAPHPDACQII